MAVKAGPKYLAPGDLVRLCEFLYRRTGMLFGESKRYYIDRRVAERIAATNANSFAAYFSLLLSEPGEAELLINSFTINETYFYREHHQLACLSRSLLPEVIKRKRPGDRIRIWSVPCSTGEEPYSIAIWLLENWRLVDAYNVEIVGSDIDTSVLLHAAFGEYGARALSRLPPELRDRYFEQVGEARWRIISDLRESVSFRAANLVDRASTAAGRAVRHPVLPQCADLFRRRRAGSRRRQSVRGTSCQGHSFASGTPNRWQGYPTSSR